MATNDRINLSNYAAVIYVDKINGNDSSNDGSVAKPYATIDKASSVATIENTLVYIVSEGVYNITNGLQGMIKTNITLTYAVDQKLYGKVIFRLMRTNYDSPQIMNKLQSFIGIVFRRGPSAGEERAYEYWYDAAKINISFNNCVFDNGALGDITPIQFPIFVGNSSGSTIIKFDYINCSFTPVNFSYAINANSSVRGNFINCAWADPNTGPTQNNLLGATFDLDYKITSGNWQNVGVGTNPDGTIASMGVYGGKYSWDLSGLVIDIFEKEAIVPKNTNYQFNFSISSTVNGNKIIKNPELILQNQLEDGNVYSFEINKDEWGNLMKLEIYR